MGLMVEMEDTGEEEIWWNAEGYNFGAEHAELRCLCDLQMELLSRQLYIQVQVCGAIWPEDADVGAVCPSRSCELG